MEIYHKGKPQSNPIPVIMPKNHAKPLKNQPIDLPIPPVQSLSVALYEGTVLVNPIEHSELA
jgi:hypothetical protein